MAITGTARAAEGDRLGAFGVDRRQETVRTGLDAVEADPATAQPSYC